jgi:hypothetical protein
MIQRALIEWGLAKEAGGRFWIWVEMAKGIPQWLKRLRRNAEFAVESRGKTSLRG